MKIKIRRKRDKDYTFTTKVKETISNNAINVRFKVRDIAYIQKKLYKYMKYETKNVT